MGKRRIVRQELQKLTHQEATDLTPALNLIALMLACEKLEGFTNKSAVENAADLALEALLYMQRQEPKPVHIFYAQVRAALEKKGT